jgi:hypothetical protein
LTVAVKDGGSRQGTAESQTLHVLKGGTDPNGKVDLQLLNEWSDLRLGAFIINRGADHLELALAAFVAEGARACSRSNCPLPR